MELSVPEHITYLSGYMDAVGRAYTTDKILYTLEVSLIREGESFEKNFNVKIVEENKVSNMVRHIENSISSILNTDPRERLLFYLIEYLMWLEEFTDSCECKVLNITGEKLPENYLCYSFLVNEIYNIKALICVSEKSAQNA
ncbi:MAG: hypothetical protein OEZ16_12265 [Chromatiales bacterium]|nr:hypothetical protein [Chromatiales bacterium]